MRSLNKAMIIGHLGADPEVRYTQSNTAVANISVATSERYKDGNGEWKEQTEWHRVVAWGRLAEICQEYLKKGSLVYVEGPINTRQWEDRDGQTRYSTEIKALTLTMLDTRGNTGSKGSETDDADPVSSKADTGDDLEEIEDDLPF